MSDVFSLSPAELSSIATRIVELAQENGAGQAQVSLSQSQGLSTHMRQGRVLSRTREIHSGFALTVFNDGKRGTVNSTDMREQTILDAVKAATNLARYTGEDRAAGPASADQLCKVPREIDIFHPWDLDESEAVAIAHRLEAGLTQAGDQVESDGAWVKTSQSYYHLSTSEGFNQGMAQSSHTLSMTALARSASCSELDFWSVSARKATELDGPEWIGEKAGRGALAYLNQRAVKSIRCPVLFDPRSAVSLLGHFAQAASGQALFTNNSYLRGQLGQPIFAEHVSIDEDPFLLAGKASIAFDGDGIAPLQRRIVDAGALTGYMLSLYASRRLAMTPTGNGFGPSNLRLSSSLTTAQDTFPAMLKQLGTGFLVTSLAGNGVRLINGDYSRGARGFWVEHGEIQHAVTGITIASNLNQMLRGITAVGNDCLSQGAFTTGSLLIDEMQISGN